MTAGSAVVDIVYRCWLVS